MLICFHMFLFLFICLVEYAVYSVYAEDAVCAECTVYVVYEVYAVCVCMPCASCVRRLLLTSGRRFAQCALYM